MTTRRIIHVSREGKVLGQYPPEQLPPLLDSGHFRESDLCSSEEHPDWMPMPQFLKKIEPPKYTRAQPSEKSSGDKDRKSRAGGSSRRNAHAGHNATAILAGWVAFLLSVAILVGAGFWIAGLYAENHQLATRINELDEKLAAKEKEYQRLLFSSREVAEDGVIRGTVALRNDAGKRVAMPGAQIALFSRKVIEKYLDERAEALRELPDNTTVDGNLFFMTDMPSPLQSTMTDASGRFEFPIREPGEYVVFARLSIFSQGGSGMRLWFVTFNSQDPLNTLIKIDESNVVQQFVPALMVISGR